MTSKQIYEAVLIESNKLQAPALKVYEFNYFVNQAISQFVNKVYSLYETTQQTTDDLGALKATATLAPKEIEPTGNKALDYYKGDTYLVEIPTDYLHMLNCICVFEDSKKCGKVTVVGATKLVTDSWSGILEDVYNRPTKKKPYYYIHNQNDIYTDSAQENILTDRNSELPTNVEIDNPNLSRTFNYFNEDEVTTVDAVDKPAGSRHVNPNKIKMEIRCGRDRNKDLKLAAVEIGYIKAPKYIRLTQEQLDSEKDISQIMEFPDYVNQEIINELVNLILRKTNDPGLVTHAQITQSIARPTGQSQ